MNVFKSIQWRLQIWYGLVLVAVLASLGIIACRLQRDLQLRDVDDALQRQFSFVADLLHPSEEGPPPGDDDEPPPGEGPPGHPPREGIRLRMPLSGSQLFEGSGVNSFFYLVEKTDGTELARSTNAPSVQAFKTLIAGLKPPSRRPGEPKRQPPTPRSFAGFRLIAVRTPPGFPVVVGCPLAPLWRASRVAELQLAGASAVILFFGLAGGWWISRRAISPISSISATAATIAAGNLAQRINVTDTESELGELALVLNSTFARLETAFAQQQQFTSNAAHELRTPVTVMLTHTQTALQRERSASEYRLSIEACHRSAQRMRRLITSLLELARLDAGQEIFQSAKFDFAKTVGECIELVRPMASERGIQFQARLDPVELKGDPDRLGRVATNLLTNAIQYNCECGEVRVTLEARDHQAFLTVADTGVGIAAGDLPHVFERFYRADPSRSAESAHAGLGLAICKSIVEAHGGTIEAASTPGQGAAFVVRLPAA